MTYNEAIKMVEAKLNCMSRNSSGIDEDCIHSNCDNCKLNYEQGTIEEQKEALRVVISAMEKQIPKKPVMGYAFGEKLRVVLQRTEPEKAERQTDCCPACGRVLDRSHFVRMQTGLRRGAPYCKRCGQAIDWSEDNE